jgi:hypothetical protein
MLYFYVWLILLCNGSVQSNPTYLSQEKEESYETTGWSCYSVTNLAQNFRLQISSVKARLEMPLCQQQTIAAEMPAFVYLKRAGKQRLWLVASWWGSISHWFGAVYPGVEVRSVTDAISQVVLDGDVDVNRVLEWPDWASNLMLQRTWCAHGVRKDSLCPCLATAWLSGKMEERVVFCAQRSYCNHVVFVIDWPMALQSRSGQSL